MPAWRQMSFTGTPASACLRIETIWVSVNRDFFMEPPGCKDARKFYFQGVYGSGKLTFLLIRGTAIGGRSRSADMMSTARALSGRRNKNVRTKKKPSRGPRGFELSPWR